MEIHYQQTFFNPRDLIKAARAYLSVLPKDTDILVSTGSSGCAIATAMITLSTRRLRHVFIRKPYELKSHGNKFVGWEYGEMDEAKHYVMVDDFVHSGRTINRLMKQCSERFHIGTVVVGSASGFNDSSLIEKLEKRHHIKIIIVGGY